MKKKIMLLFLVTCFLFTTKSIQADNYRVLYANSRNIKIGNKNAKKGLTFNDKEPITWTSDKQALKVINLSNNRVIVITQKGFNRKKTKSIADYLSKVKHLSTREYNTTNLVADTVLYLLDTLLIDAGKHYGDNMIDEVYVNINGQSIVTKVQKTENKKEFILSRNILGGHYPQLIYVDILETDSTRDWKYYIYKKLRIELLPLNTD